VRWGQDEVGVILTRNEIWLLLNALLASPPPSIGWDGSELEPWTVGELRSRLQAALDPDAVSDLEQRPILRIDSDMGRSLALAGIEPSVIPEGYDLGTLFAECAKRGWGAELRLPPGSTPQTPAEAIVRAERTGADGQPERAEYVGLERPVVALTRALLGALVDESVIQPGNRPGPGEAGGTAISRPDPSAVYEEHIIHGQALPSREKQATIDQMARKGWELVKEEGGAGGGKLIFRRPRRR
jgi:hypothetical protein